eukprot:5742754-Pleurochrysis_carterae.AAC.1
MMRWEASESRRVIWEILVPTRLPRMQGAEEYDVDSVKCFRLALPHAMSLPAVRLFLAGLPPEPTTTPQAVACFHEAYAQATRMSCLLQRTL